MRNLIRPRGVSMEYLHKLQVIVMKVFFYVRDHVLGIFDIFLRGSLILPLHFAINLLKTAVLSETTRTKQGLHL